MCISVRFIRLLWFNGHRIDNDAGLKTGWTFGASLFGAIIGFAVIKFFSVTFAENFPILGGKFGPKENNIIQTAATAAGGLSNIFVSAIPALYQLKLLNEDPVKDFGRIVSFTAVCAYFGFFFATPRTISLRGDPVYDVVLIDRSQEILHHLPRSRVASGLSDLHGHGDDHSVDACGHRWC